MSHLLTVDDLGAYRRVTVMGLGLFGGGAGAARFFARLGASVTVTDAATAEKLAPSIEALADLDIAYALGGHPEELFTEVDLVVANQAIRPDNPLLRLARGRGVPIMTETGIALGLNRAPWLSVTGSSGKSTTAALAAHMLSAHDARTRFGGNIGGNLITAVGTHPADAPLVVELSSFQLLHIGADFADGRIRPPRVAVVTNLTPNHLDWHADFDEYAAAKFNSLRCQAADDWAILNVDDPPLADWAEKVPGRVLRCGLSDAGGEDAAFAGSGKIVLRLGGEIAAEWPLERFALPGRHNVANAVQAAAAAFVMRRDAAAVGRGLETFPGLPHRLQYAGTAAGRRFVNDSKATTPEAACLALASLPGEKVLVAGGYDKQSPFGEMASAIQRGAVGVVLLGPAGARLRAALEAAAAERPEGMEPLAIVDGGDDFAPAVAVALRLTPEGGTVLLSPGCASYGMFVNYEERGKRFCELVRELGGAC